ncbi:MAG: DNA polymerase III subunit gamma/tau [Methylophaga sp.]|nr:MAG: DNA polymerase III subunit gamma/tau [Methylophaga sp.]
MSYLVLARKWRPKTFSEVIGQQHVLRALINGLDQDRLHHAFLFAGTRGVGKTTLARILAKSLNCEKGVSSTPCGECQSCQEVDSGRFVDLIEVDAASRTKVDDTRELLDNVQYAPSRGRYKVYLIDEVHMLSTHSFNALLKTLEEPPPHVKFLFATTDPQKLPVTILSRCLQFNLRRLDISQISGHLANILQQESIEFEAEALTEIARAADGSMRDALSLLDQAISFGAGSVTTENVHEMLGSISQQQLHSLVAALFNQDPQAALQQSDELSAQGRDFKKTLDELLLTLQGIATLQLVPDLEESDSASASSNSEQLSLLSQQIPAETIQLLYQIALHGKRDLAYAADPKSGFDMTLLRMLSFQPMKIDTNNTAVTPSAKPQTAEINNKPKETAQQQAYTEPAPKQVPKIAESAPIIEPTKPTAPAAAINNNAAEINSENWLAITERLKLTAFSRQLADNASFTALEDKTISLAISPEFAHLANDKAISRLQSALSTALQYDVKLRVQQDETPQSSPTLATERAEQSKVSQQNAKDAIYNDPAVAALKNAFNGEVIESTIKPI